MSAHAVSVLMLSAAGGLAACAGGYFTVARQLSARQVQHLVSLGAGFLLGLTFFEVLPHAMQYHRDAPLLIALGFFALLVLEHLTPGHRNNRLQRHKGAAILAGLLAHAFFEGSAVAAASFGGARAMHLLILPLVLHKLPEGFSLAAIVLGFGFSRPWAVGATVLTGLATVAGALVGLLWGVYHPEGVGSFIAVAAGTFLYIGTGSVLSAGGRPGTHRLLVIAGAAAIGLLSAVLHRGGLH